MVYQPPPAPMPPTRVTRNGRGDTWKWVLGIVATVVLLCGSGIAACAALFASGIGDIAEQQKETTRARASENAKSCTGKTYLGQQPQNDRCADSAGSVILDDVIVNAEPLRRVRAAPRSPAVSRSPTVLCSKVTYINKSGQTIEFNELDWKLQLPAGEIKDPFDNPADVRENLGSGALVKGGRKSGLVCFQSDEVGQYILIYKPKFWDDSRGIWTSAVTTR